MPTTPYRGCSSTVSQLLRGTKSHLVLKLGVLCMRGTKTILPSSRHSMTLASVVRCNNLVCGLCVPWTQIRPGSPSTSPLIRFFNNNPESR